MILGQKNNFSWNKHDTDKKIEPTAHTDITQSQTAHGDNIMNPGIHHTILSSSVYA